jgi:hypothetical protein
VEWLSSGVASKQQIRDTCTGALFGALTPIIG